MRFFVWALILQLSVVPAFAMKYRTLQGVKESTVRTLNTGFNVRSERSTTSSSLGQIQELINGGRFEVDVREVDEDWIRVRTAKGDGWIHRTALQDVEVKTDFVLRNEPNSMAANRGTIAEGLFVRENDAILTGRTEIEERNGKTNKWHEIFVRGERAWVHENAITKKEEAAVTPTPASERASAEAKAEEKVEEKPKPKPEVQCVGSLNEARGEERFQKLLSRGNPFTTWNGPWGATIAVQSNGQAILNHPMKGKIPLTLALCMDKRDRAFITVNGAKIYFKDENMSRISVTDPTSGDAYDFSRGVQ